VLPDDSVWNRAASHWNRDHAAARCLDGLADRLGNFVRLAGRESDASLAIANCDECIEGETTSALYNLGNAVDRNDIFDEIAATLTALPTTSTVTSATGATSAARAATSTLTAALASAALTAALASATAASATTSATALSAAATLLAAAGARTAPGSASVAAGAATSGATSGGTACAAARGWRSALLLFVSH
jgi:hypothetical protein